MSAWRVTLIAAAVLALMAPSRASTISTWVRAPKDRDPLFAPIPTYPASARSRHITGYGYFKLRVQVKTGRVRQVITVRSTGHAELDSAAIQAFQQWRYKPGALPPIRKDYPKTHDPLADEVCNVGVPTSFVLTHAGARVDLRRPEVH